MSVGPKNVPYIVTHDGRTIRYPDPLVKVNDTIKLDIATSKIEDLIKFDSGTLARFVVGMLNKFIHIPAPGQAPIVLHLAFYMWESNVCILYQGN